MFILVPCNTSLSKNYVVHSYVTVVCVIDWIWEKNWFICTRWLSVHMKAVVEQRFFHEFAFDNKALKTFVEFRIWWKCSKFESLNHIPNAKEKCENYHFWSHLLRNIYIGLISHRPIMNNWTWYCKLFSVLVEPLMRYWNFICLNSNYSPRISF